MTAITKRYYENPDIFIFAQFNEDIEKWVKYIENVQKSLEESGYSPKVLINCPESLRVNSINHCYRVGERMETNLWWDYGNPIRNRVWIHTLKMPVDLLAQSIIKEDTSNKEDCEIIIKK